MKRIIPGVANDETAFGSMSPTPVSDLQKRAEALNCVVITRKTWEVIKGYGGMTLNEYQRKSMRTATPLPAGYPDARWLFQVSGLGLGVAGEAGEVADYLKKVIHHGHTLDRETVKKELGDVLWYVQAIAARSNLTLEEVAQANIDKLKARYPNGWTSEDSINRKDSE